MAKQRINILEAHIEKVVLGITAVVLLVAAFLYLIQTPNVIDTGGQAFGPGDYDSEVVRAKAERLGGLFDRSPADPESVPDIRQEFKRQQDGPLASVTGAERWPAFQPWRPTVPPALGIKPTPPGQIRLTRVPPPAQPVAYPGLTTIEVLPAAPLGGASLSVQERRDLQASIRERDRSWVTVAAVLDLEAQRDEFRRMQYDSDLRNIILCGLRAQRQRLLPSGAFGAWEDFKIWTPYEKPEPPSIKLVARGEGYAISGEDTERIGQFIQSVYDYALELKTPLPPFSTAGDVWRLPPLEDVDWCALDLQWLQLEGDRDGCNSYYSQLPKPVLATEDGSGSDGGAVSKADLKRQGRMKAAKDYRRAEELSDSDRLNDLYEAEDLLRNVRSNKHATKRLKEKADRVLASVLIKIDELEAQQGPAAEGEAQPDDSIQPTIEEEQRYTVVWMYDMPVESGHTYRYRIAVDIYNTYVGNYEKLKDKAAASSVLVRGEWSQPSEPVEVKPEAGFFVTSSDGQEAKIDLYRWYRGRIAYRKVRVGLGDRITLQDFVKIPGERDRFAVDFDTGFTLVGMEERVTLTRETVGRTGAFRYREETTPVIICVDDRGRIVERSKVGDQVEQREWSGLTKNKKFKTE